MTAQTAFTDAESVRQRINRMQQALAGAGFTIDTQAAAHLLGKGLASETFAAAPQNMSAEQVARLAHVMQRYHDQRLREPEIWLKVSEHGAPGDPGRKAPWPQPVPEHHQPSDLAPLMVAEQYAGSHPGVMHLSHVLLNPNNLGPSLNGEWRSMRVACDDANGTIVLCRDPSRLRSKEEWPDSMTRYNADAIMFELALVEENYKRRAAIRPRFGDCMAGSAGEVSLWRRATHPEERASESDWEEILRGFEYGVLLMATAAGQDPAPFQRALRSRETPEGLDRFRWVAQEAFCLRTTLCHMRRSPLADPGEAEFYCPFTKTIRTGRIMRLPQRWQRFLLRWKPRQKTLIVDGNHDHATKSSNWALQGSAGNPVRELRGNAVLVDHDRFTNQHFVAFAPGVPKRVRTAILENPGQLLMSQGKDGSMTLHGKPQNALPPLQERTHTVREMTDFELHIGPANIQGRPVASY